MSKRESTHIFCRKSFEYYYKILQRKQKYKKIISASTQKNLYSIYQIKSSGSFDTKSLKNSRRSQSGTYSRFKNSRLIPFSRRFKVDDLFGELWSLKPEKPDIFP